MPSPPTTGIDKTFQGVVFLQLFEISNRIKEVICKGYLRVESHGDRKHEVFWWTAEFLSGRQSGRCTAHLLNFYTEKLQLHNSGWYFLVECIRMSLQVWVFGVCIDVYVGITCYYCCDRKRMKIVSMHSPNRWWRTTHAACFFADLRCFLHRIVFFLPGMHLRLLLVEPASRLGLFEVRRGVADDKQQAGNV